jgi:hypothetical protein
MDLKPILESAGIEAGKIDGIIAQINKEVGKNFVDKARYDTKLTELSTMQGELNTANDGLATANGWKEKFDAETAAHKATKDAYGAEKTAAAIDGKVSAALKKAGMNEKVIDKALKLYKREDVKLNDKGELSEESKVIDAFKADWADFFGAMHTEGSNSGNSAGSNSSPYAGKTLNELMQAANDKPADLEAIMAQVDIMTKASFSKKEGDK